MIKVYLVEEDEYVPIEFDTWEEAGKFTDWLTGITKSVIRIEEPEKEES